MRDNERADHVEPEVIPVYEILQGERSTVYSKTLIQWGRVKSGNNFMRALLNSSTIFIIFFYCNVLTSRRVKLL